MRDRERLRSFLRRERLRLLLRERDLLPSSAFSALLERERLLLFETEEASESSSLAMSMLGVSRGDGVSCLQSRSWIKAGYLLFQHARGCAATKAGRSGPSGKTPALRWSLLAHARRTTRGEPERRQVLATKVLEDYPHPH